MPLTTGAHFGAYEIVARLGAGGMGEVWRARDPSLEREVALKVLPVTTVADKTARARLLREARMASRLNHPNVCTVYEVGEAEGQAYIAMERVAGQTLSDRLSSGRMDVDEVVRLGHQIADALAHAHENRVVHRDLKSANVIVTPEGRVKVLDFGLAKPLAETDPDTTAPTATPLTVPGAVVGTLAYMSPEQLRGRSADERSDVWALGVVLHEMAGGERPFAGQTAYELSEAILNRPPRPLPVGVPPALAAVIEGCFPKDPAERYQTAGEVRSALEALHEGTEPVAWPEQRRRSLLKERRHLRIRMAVLPFANLTGDPEQEYLSDGLTQEMIAQLGKLHPQSLSVIARSSVMRYKEGDTPVDQIGRELKVDYVLEGSARREADLVRITAELIHVQDQTQLWADTYERELSGLLALQSEVAERVAQALALELLPAEQARFARVRAVDPEACDAYLKGLHHWHKLTPGDLDSAQRYFELAIEKDPGYASAYSGIALVWAGRAQHGFVSPAEAAPKAKAAATKAIELDDTVAETHYALACVRTWVDWDWAGAEPGFKRAIELNPSFPDAQIYYSHFLMIMGRPDEALPYARRSLELDPFNPLFHSLYAADFMFVRNWDEAIAHARTALATAADDAIAYFVLWHALAAMGLHKEALAAVRAYMKLLYDDGDVDEAFEQGFAEAGYEGALRRAADPLIAHFNESYVSPFDIAYLYAEAKESSPAVEWLEKGYEVRDQNMPYIGLPMFDSLRSNPRFQDLFRRMNLPLG